MKCPGQDTRFWQEGAIYEVDCPECGRPVEFFKDESARKCRNCGHRFLNPRMDFGCATYCKFAAECLGDLPPELLAKREDLLKDRVAVEMKLFLKRDFRRIGHAMKVARHAEKIARGEGGDPGVVIAAGYLHDIEGRESEDKVDGARPPLRDPGGPAAAREILDRLGARPEMIDEVCAIIHRHPDAEQTLNFKCFHDADLIAGLEENQKDHLIEGVKLTGIIAGSFLTETGRRLARDTLLGQS